MAYGRLCGSQAEILSETIRDQVVHDLGAGDCTLSQQLLDLGARKVIAIDSEFRGQVEPSVRLQVVQTTFDRYTDGIDIAFLSWPVNHHSPGLVPLIRRAPIVIYLGKNTSGVMCGTQPMFHHLIRRRVHRYAPHPDNVMIIYGRKFESGLVTRSPYQEERGALTTFVNGPKALTCKPIPYSEDESAFGVRVD